MNIIRESIKPKIAEPKIDQKKNNGVSDKHDSSIPAFMLKRPTKTFSDSFPKAK